MKLGRHIARGKGTLSMDLSSNNLDLGKWWPFLGSEITFSALFSKSIVFIRTKLGRGIARDKWHIVREFDLNQP